MANNTRQKKPSEADLKRKQKRITAEIAKLKTMFKELGDEIIETVHSLIENAAFMTITMEDLQKEINEKGCISEYQNGENQWGTKKSPEVEVYTTMVQRHATVMKQLTDLIPRKQPVPKDDGFDKFVNGRDDV